MPYIFSHAQIDRAYHLLADHNYNVNQVADVMNCNVRNAWHLINEVNKRYPHKKVVNPKEFKVKRYHGNRFFQEEKPVVIVRPKAEYSNPRPYELI